MAYEVIARSIGDLDFYQLAGLGRGRVPACTEWAGEIIRSLIDIHHPVDLRRQPFVPSFEQVLGLFSRTVNQHLHGRTDPFSALPRSDHFLNSEQLVTPFLHEGPFDLLLERKSRRALFVGIQK